MDFRDVAMAVAAAVAGGLALAAAPARSFAAPLDEPHVGGMVFSGPTSGDITSIYWNPAALGLVGGARITVSGTLRVSRAAIDGATGPASAVTVGVPVQTFIDPVKTALGPGGFFGAVLGGDRFTLAAAVFTPFHDRESFRAGPSPDLDGPTRYHRLDADLRHTTVLPALAIRIAGDFRIGFAPGFLFSTGRLRFDEDVAAAGGGFGLPKNAARYDLSSGQGLFDSSFSFTLAGGLYYRWQSVEIGASYSSRPITDVDGVRIRAGKTTVERPAIGGGGALPCPAYQPEDCTYAEIVYRLPDVTVVGVGWRPTLNLKLEAMARWLTFSRHDRMDIRLSGVTLRFSGLPDHIVLYRGFKDVVDARIRASYTPTRRLRLGLALRAETSAVPRRSVNPAAIDGFKLQPIGLAELRAATWLVLTAGYGVTLMPRVNVTESRFDPSLAAACEATGDDLRSPACQARNQGLARPSANGSYRRTTHEMGFSMTAEF